MDTKKIKSYNLPVLLITNVISTLEKDGVSYAHLINAENEKGEKYKFRERRGLPLEQYIGKTVECVLEIIEAEFHYPESKEEIKKLPGDILHGTYLWSESGYKFIPELVEMIEGDPDDEDHDYDEDEYDRIAADYFNNWGVSGLGLGIYQNKPMLQTENGIYLLNEYQNEDDIEEWEYEQKIYFRPKTFLLRGIKPVEVKEWGNHKHAEITAGHNEMLIRGGWSVLDPY